MAESILTMPVVTTLFRNLFDNIFTHFYGCRTVFNGVGPVAHPHITICSSVWKVSSVQNRTLPELPSLSEPRCCAHCATLCMYCCARVACALCTCVCVCCVCYVLCVMCVVCCVLCVVVVGGCFSPRNTFFFKERHGAFPAGAQGSIKSSPGFLETFRKPGLIFHSF